MLFRSHKYLWQTSVPLSASPCGNCCYCTVKQLMLFHSYFIPRLLRLKTRYSILYFLFCFKSFCDLSPVLSPILHFAFIIYAAFSIIFCYFLHFSCISKPIFLRILLLHRYIKSRCISFISLIHLPVFSNHILYAEHYTVLT